MFGKARLQESQYPLTFFCFIPGITLLQTAFNTVAPCLPPFVFETVLFINGEISLRKGDEALTLITFCFPQ